MQWGGCGACMVWCMQWGGCGACSGVGVVHAVGWVWCMHKQGVQKEKAISVTNIHNAVISNTNLVQLWLVVVSVQ